MREPQLVPAPSFAPGRCFVCGGNEGVMVDTMVDVIGDGRVYLCLRTCLPLFAALAGYLTPAQSEDLARRLGAAQERLNVLEADLAYERSHKLVSLADAIKFGGERRFPISVCSATRADGTPCTAEALPNHDVCLSHSKRKALA